MKSLICPIEGNERDIERAITEANTFSKLEGLNDQQTNIISLLSDEMLGMVNGLFVSQLGRFWLEHNDDSFELNLAVETEVGTRAKAVLDSTSANTEYKGFYGLVKRATDAISQMFDDSGAEAFNNYDTPFEGVNTLDQGAYEWSLKKFEESCERDEKAALYDELEIPVIKKFSKDINISYRNKRVNIKVTANV